VRINYKNNIILYLYNYIYTSLRVSAKDTIASASSWVIESPYIFLF